MYWFNQRKNYVYDLEEKELNIMVFCSNPVNGGTARIFYEMVENFKLKVGKSDSVYPCINKNNTVEIYQEISDLIELPILSAETIFPEMYGGILLKRIINSVIRSTKYLKIKKDNIKCICEFIRNKHIDSVIIHNGGYVGDDLCNQVLEAAYLCRDIVKNRTYILHNEMEKNIISKLRFRGYDNKISREATHIVTVSEYTKNRIKKSSFISQDIEVIYDGINVVKRKSKEELANLVHVDSEKHNILMIGNFLENKGQKQFIECADILFHQDKDYRFTIIGNIYDEKYYRECIGLINSKSLQDVFAIYHGLNNASDYIDMHDVMVVPSMYDESFGLISVEAMASGVPVVAFACGGIPEVVDDERNGFLVPIGDTQKMADRIFWLINHKNDADQISKQCLEDYRKKFSTSAMVDQYLKLIQKN